MTSCSLKKTCFRISLWLTALVTVCGVMPAQALDFSAIFKRAGINTKTPLSETRIGEGLKEALKVGTDKAVRIAGAKDGYFANQAIRIAMPSKVKSIEPALRKIGLGSQLDEWVLSMNRAAEKAAPYARDLFIDAITQMSIDDAQKILNGSQTAATDYLQAKTEGQLKTIYQPVVQEAMQTYGVTRVYQDLTGKIPFASGMKAASLEDYVTRKALDGLFYTLGEQEKAIRTDPAARVTSILKEVFSSQNG